MSSRAQGLKIPSQHLHAPEALGLPKASRRASIIQEDGRIRGQGEYCKNINMPDAISIVDFLDSSDMPKPIQDVIRFAPGIHKDLLRQAYQAVDVSKHS